MQDIFIDMLHHEMEDYVDDNIVKAKTKKDHLSILLKVLQRCTSYNLWLNPKKCTFGISSDQFLGFWCTIEAYMWIQQR